MKASVFYNDYSGTVAADRCDMFVEQPHMMESSIVEKFHLPIKAEDYRYVGISLSGTDAEKFLVYFFFQEKKTRKYVKCLKYDVSMQAILDLFKRFELQIGIELEGIDDNSIEEI